MSIKHQAAGIKQQASIIRHQAAGSEAAGFRQQPRKQQTLSSREAACNRGITDRRPRGLANPFRREVRPLLWVHVHLHKGAGDHIVFPV